MSETPMILQVDALSRRFGRSRGLLRGNEYMWAVDQVSLELQQGETLGIVGESGCGKSTLARMLVGLDRADAGTIRLFDQLIDGHANRYELARVIQYVFQDPVASLNPRKTVEQVLDAPLRHLLHLPAEQRRQRIAELMQAVGLLPGQLYRYPHEFSGGQAQRIGIARALAASAKVLVLDEPVSALDVSIQAQILKLLAELRERFNLSYIFISHDLSVVESISDRVAVMYFGKVVETGPARALFAQPKHPYTRLLIDSAPSASTTLPESESIELPDPFNPPRGCSFARRCPRAQDKCHEQQPSLESVDDSHKTAAACWFPLTANNH
ncbi:MAG: ATP-binding cassette domain-containing protein [Gammaproteobacteria bacterium]